MNELAPKPEQKATEPGSEREALIDSVNSGEQKALQELSNPNLGLSTEQQHLVGMLIHDLCISVNNSIDEELPVPENPYAASFKNEG